MTKNFSTTVSAKHIGAVSYFNNLTTMGAVPIDLTFFVLLSKFVYFFKVIVNFCMIRSRDKLKIFNSVVKFIPIFVMNSFNRKWLELSTNKFFHYKSMFKNVSSSNACIRMIWRKNEYITIRSNGSPTIPFWMLCSRIFPNSGLRHFSSCFGAWFVTFLEWHGGDYILNKHILQMNCVI